jgi:hypothetical protein
MLDRTNEIIAICVAFTIIIMSFCAMLAYINTPTDYTIRLELKSDNNSAFIIDSMLTVYQNGTEVYKTNLNDAKEDE